MNHDELIDIVDSPDRRRDVSVVDLVRAFLERVARYQPVLNALITVTADAAIRDAKKVDRARERGKRLPLDGMPIVVKDNIDVAGVRTTVGSKFFESNVAERDSEAVRRVRAAGGVVVGKSNLHELVFGGTTNNVFYGTCRNPWDLDRIPGGSSGGSAVALAADLCIGALGSDTGGSIRIPAALNGVVGLRPTFGLVSNRGAFPISCSLDTVGPMARSAVDVAAILGVIAGYDAADPWSSKGPRPNMNQLHRGLQGTRIGLVESLYFYDDIDNEIERCVRDAAHALKSLGAIVEQIEISDLEKANEVCSQMIRTEGLALHRRRYYEQPELFSDDTRRRLSLAEQVRGIDFADLVRFAYEWRCSMRGVFDRVDLLFSPMIPFPTPRIAEAEMLATTASVARPTYPWSLAHLPAISIPCGLNHGLPVGYQLAAQPRGESALLRAALAYQSVTDWHRRRPTMDGDPPAIDSGDTRHVAIGKR